MQVQQYPVGQPPFSTTFTTPAAQPLSTPDFKVMQGLSGPELCSCSPLPNTAAATSYPAAAATPYPVGCWPTEPRTVVREFGFFRCFPKLFLFHSCNGLLSQMLAVSNPALLFTTPNVELMATHIKICATLRTPFASMPTSNSATMESALAPGLVLWAVAQATSFRTMG